MFGLNFKKSFGLPIGTTKAIALVSFRRTAGHSGGSWQPKAADLGDKARLLLPPRGIRSQPTATGLKRITLPTPST
jgi:hypothetical protein